MDGGGVCDALHYDGGVAGSGSRARRHVYKPLRGVVALSGSWLCLYIRFHRQPRWPDQVQLSGLLPGLFHGEHWCLGHMVSDRFIICG